MNTHADHSQKNVNSSGTKASQSVANNVSQKIQNEEQAFQFTSELPESISQSSVQALANDSPQVKQLAGFQQMANNQNPVKQFISLRNLEGESLGENEKAVDLSKGSDEIMQRVLLPLQIPPLSNSLTPLFSVNPANNIPGLISAAFHAASATDGENAIMKSCFDSIITAFSLLDPRVQFAASINESLVAKLTSLSWKIWGRDEVSNKVIKRLKATDIDDTGQAEAFQLVPVLPNVLWSEVAFASLEAIEAAGRKATLLLAQHGYINPVDLLRIEQAFNRYTPDAALPTSDLPSRASLSATITEDVMAYGVPIQDHKGLEPEEIEALRPREQQMREATVHPFKKDDVVMIALIQNNPVEFVVEWANQPYYIDRTKVRLSEEPATGPLGGGSVIPLFEGGVPKADDIGQQALGDCYLLASLGSLANQKPTFVQEMIKSVGGDAYAVRLYEKSNVGGFKTTYNPKWIKVNDRVYVDEHGQPIYAKGNKALWPGIIEKAYAVIKGSFAAIGSGDDPANAMEIIMGKPSSSEGALSAADEGPLGSKLYSPKAILIFKKIEAAVGGSGLVVLGTDAWGQGGTGISGGENTTDVAGLASTHAYSVIATKGDPDKDGALHVTIRNPWGHFGRKYDSKWRRSGFTIYTEIIASEQEGGTFDMELSDLMRYGDRLSFNV